MSFKSLLRTNIILPHVYRIFHRSCSTNIKEKIQLLVTKNKVVVFMKGVPENPRCGFSNAVAQILRMHGVQYDSYNVLEDEQLRQGMYISMSLYWLRVSNSVTPDCICEIWPLTLKGQKVSSERMIRVAKH